MRLTFAQTTAGAIGFPDGDDVGIEQAHLHDATTLEEGLACYRRLFGLRMTQRLSVRSSRYLLEIDVADVPTILRVPNHPVALSSAMIMHR